jgi:hypothetical protein
MSSRFKVSATALNLRAEPVIKPSNRLATLPNGHEVERLAVAPDGRWWKVRTVLNGATVEGFVASEHLTPVTEFSAPPGFTRLVAVHLAEGRPNVTRDSLGGAYAFPLGEPGQPRRNGTNAAQRAAALGQIVEWLDVERKKRYQPKGGSTYCNIYAHDYCYLAGAYLPRVWWRPRSIAELMQGHSVSPLYGTTVAEINANGLFDWLTEFGPDFGWKRTFSLDELQGAANDGGVALICAKRKDLNRSGHITAVVPESDTHRATRSGGAVTVPLQSQAGVKNYSYKPLKWWTNEKFRSYGFFTHP